jgi:hydroxysqualene synthase
MARTAPFTYIARPGVGNPGTRADGRAMTTVAQASSGKTHRDENFPVASFLIDRRHRATILAFYRFVRAADDVADHPTLAAQEKLALLDRLEESLLGESEAASEAFALRAALAERDLSTRHAQDLLNAFRQDVTKLRYRDWDDLIDYCALSAMPVGRFVLDVHGESRSTWPSSDALCAALQIINHLQDCAADYRRLDRVYIPLDALERSGTGVDALAAARASPALRACLSALAARTGKLLDEAQPLATLVRDLRLGLEISVIHRLARSLVRRLARRDPLSERVHLTTIGFAGLGAISMIEGALRRVVRSVASAGQKVEQS